MKPSITKSSLRKTVLQYRRLLSEEEFSKRNKALLSNLKKHMEENNCHVIHTFLPMVRNKEVDVTPLFDWMWENNIQIIVSRTDFKTRVMLHFLLEKNTVLVENKMGIPEPLDATPVDFHEVDLILVPLLAFDKNKNRIGYGGGFYDRLLNETKAAKVGLSLSPPLDQLIQKEEWDVPMDHIISTK